MLFLAFAWCRLEALNKTGNDGGVLFIAAGELLIELGILAACIN